MFKSLFVFLGFGWSKWTVVEENKKMIAEDFNPITGYKSKPYTCYVDVLRRENKLNGDVEYKNLPRT